MQFPLRMAQQGVIAGATGVLPAPTEGLDFTNTGVVLITDHPVEGVESQTPTWGLAELLGLARSQAWRIRERGGRHGHPVLRIGPRHHRRPSGVAE